MPAADRPAVPPAPTDALLAIEERDFVNHWMRFGTAAVVAKLGRSWRVWGGRLGHPLFPTKREAMQAADAQVSAIGRRRAAEADA